jgi:leader peptidase (prepilin peptidase)/N-methyltransferase
MLASALLFASWIDLDRFLLPDVLSLPLCILGVAVTYYLGGDIYLSIGGAFAGYGVIAGIAWLWRKRFGRDGLGLGDAKLLAAGGAWVGVLNLPFVLLIASGLGLCLALAFRLAQKTSKDVAIPFGPLLSLGIWMAWCLPLI